MRHTDRQYEPVANVTWRSLKCLVTLELTSPYSSFFRWKGRRVSKCNKASPIRRNFKQFPVGDFFDVSLLFLEGGGQKASRGYKTLVNTTSPFSTYPIKRAHPLGGALHTHGCISWTIPPIGKLSEPGLTSVALNPKYTIQIYSTCGPPFRDLCQSICVYVCLLAVYGNHCFRGVKMSQ